MDTSRLPSAASFSFVPDEGLQSSDATEDFTLGLGEEHLRWRYDLLRLDGQDFTAAQEHGRGVFARIMGRLIRGGPVALGAEDLIDVKAALYDLNDDNDANSSVRDILNLLRRRLPRLLDERSRILKEISKDEFQAALDDLVRKDRENTSTM